MDVLGLLEGLEALLAELAPEARLLHPAERAGVVVGQRVVEPDRAGLDLAHAAHDRLEVARVDVAAEPVARRVRELDRLVEARTGTIGATGPNVSSRSRSVSAGAPVTTAGAKKWPGPVPRAVAAGHELGARRDRALDLRRDLLALARRDHRADVGVRVERVAEHERARVVDERRAKSS